MNDPLFHNMEPDIFGMRRCLNMSQLNSLLNQPSGLGFFELLSPNCERQYDGSGFEFACKKTIALAKNTVETQGNSWCEMSSMFKHFKPSLDTFTTAPEPRMAQRRPAKSISKRFLLKTGSQLKRCRSISSTLAVKYSFFLKIRLSSRGVLTQGAQAPAGVTVSKLFQTGVDQGMVATCANRRPAVVSFLLVPQPKIASDSENNKKQVAVFFSILH